MIKDLLLLSANEPAAGYFIVSNIRKATSSNQPALSFKLSDVSGTISAKIWNMPSEIPSEGKIVFVEGAVDVYTDIRSVKVNSIKTVSKNQVPNLSELVPYASVSGEYNYDYIRDFAETNIKDEALKSVVLKTLEWKKDKLVKWPGAKSIHHDSIGGLMEHTSGMLMMAKAIAECRKGINTDILYSAVILHDVAKLREFDVSELGLVSEYSVSGELLGHIMMGVMGIGNMCTREHVSPENSLMLCHAIAAHHGKPEYNSPVMPKTREAFLLHELDMIDSRLNIFDKAERETEPGCMSEKVFGLDNVRVYCQKGGK